MCWVGNMHQHGVIVSEHWCVLGEVVCLLPCFCRDFYVAEGMIIEASLPAEGGKEVSSLAVGCPWHSCLTKEAFTLSTLVTPAPSRICTECTLDKC